MRVVSSKSAVSKIMIIVLVVAIVIVGGTVAVYLATRPGSPTSSPAPSPALTPTPSTTSTPLPSLSTNPTSTPISTAASTSSPGLTSTPTIAPTPSPALSHVVPSQEMANDQMNYWNITPAQSYTVSLNDSMTVSSGDQYLLITALNGGSSVWSVTYITSTTYQIGGDSTVFNCANGLITVTVTNTSITFTGTSSYTVPATFQSLSQIRTVNGDGNFNGGELGINLTMP